MSAAAEAVFLGSSYKGAVIVPIVFGANRLRGNQRGAMIDDEAGDHLSRLRQALRDCADANGFEATTEYLRKTVQQLLTLYEGAHDEYLATRTDQIGHVYEGLLPNGATLLMAETRVLRRMRMLA